MAEQAVSRVLTPSEFFGALRQSLGPLLPFEWRTYHRPPARGRLLKIDYGHPETHYEVWHHAGRGRLEVGLHFEGAAALNEAAFLFFRARMVEFKAGLPRAELEPWDRGWKRIYETVPAVDLTTALSVQAAALLAAYVTTLQPALDEFWALR